LLIQPKFLTLSDLLANRLFRIPQYQRSYSWERKHRDDMFADIEALRDKPDSRHFMATIVGLNRGQTTIMTDEYSVIEVVDGQQRITTLILLLKAIQIELAKEQAKYTKLAEELQEVLIKQDNISLILLQMNHDPNGYFAKYLRTGETAAPDIAHTLADRALLNAMRECGAFVRKWGDLIQLTAIIKNRLTFIFHEIDDEATVYTVFEVLNSRGLSVPWVDRLKSILMAIAFEYGSGNREAIIEELHTIWEGVYQTIGLRQGLSTEALRFAATLKSKAQRSKALGEEDAVDSLYRQCGTDPGEAVKTSYWLLEVAKAVEQFLGTPHRSKAVTRIAHARLLAIAIVLTKFPKETEAKLLQLWEKISFRVFGLCRKDARTQVGEYVRLAWDCVNKKIASEEVEARLLKIGSDDREHSIEWAVENIKHTNCYEGWEEELRYLMYRYEEDKAGASFTNEQWHRIWEQSASHSIEHIKPQESGAAFVHYLGNLMLLPPGLNTKLSNKSPSTKVPDYRSVGMFAASEVADMIEEKGGWGVAQVDEREKNILEWVAKTWA
jgi:Protein of unknown function DUF262/Protein of unknown function (DUF1524)